MDGWVGVGVNQSTHKPAPSPPLLLLLAIMASCTSCGPAQASSVRWYRRVLAGVARVHIIWCWVSCCVGGGCVGL